MSTPFNQPSSGDWFKPAEAHGHLILITKVHQIGEKYDSLASADKPHAVFDMVDLNSPNPVLQQHVNDTHPGIVGKLGKALRTGEMVLGRITQAPGKGDNLAWVLGPYAPGDEQYGTAWLNANPLNNFGQPAGQQQNRPAPAPAPQAQQQAPQQYAQGPQQQYPPQGMPQQYAPQPAPAPAAAPPQQYAPQAPQPQYGPPQQAAAPAPQPQQYAQQQPQPAPPATAPQMDLNNPTPEVQALLQKIAQGGGQLPPAPPQGA
ncbi:hypothetical protein [Actinomadura sp. DC4]|uniref:hypothetical protein n=1 Tax=Actinomadura sp. DC4 TaxID=3055069 RepID=UPI0025B1EC33|nr:hypothetical protein [Actinomadura sp. DC4]MDN3356053.1 hypothetical protein [Actinomadura sp. DC4]